MKKKVMFLISNLNIGGTEKALLNMLEIMDPTLYDVDLYLLEEKGGFLNEVPKWVNLKIVPDYEYVKSWVMDPPLNVVKKLLKEGHMITALKLLITHIILKVTDDRTAYYKVILNHMNSISKKYDIAIAYSGPMDFITIYILEKVFAREKIQWIHFDVSNFNFNHKFARKNYKFFEKIVAVSKQAADKLIEKIPLTKNKIEVIHNFLPVKQCMEKSLEYNPYDENKKTKIILTVGRLTSEKGQIIIPEVVKVLVERGNTNFIWYIVGDGNQREKISQKIKEYNLENYIKLEGEKKNPYPYYRNIDLYVQTSLHEGYCITIAEALLFKKYIISTDVAGAYDQILNKDIGIITKFDKYCLADSIERKLKD